MHWPSLCLLLLLLLLASVAAAQVPKLPSDFGPCPRELEPFLRYIVERRAAEALNRANPEAPDPKDVTLYGGGSEDANVAWIGAAAYKFPWSRWHENQVVRQRSFALLDALVKLQPRGEWDDGGLGAFFMLHSLAWAMLEWQETGAVEPERLRAWLQHLRLTADFAMLCDAYGPYRPSALTGQYANPEMYYLAGLAATWKLTGEDKYREEAARTLRSYDRWLFPGGGMAYFTASAPQHGYQQMVVKSVALYYDLTGDEHALDMMRRLAPYFPNVQHRSGLETDAEQPQLKHGLANHLNPASAVLVACLTGDGANRWAADCAVPLQADGCDGKLPSFKDQLHWAWYNYHATTYAASALRVMAKHPLPAPKPLPAQRVFVDESFRGVRSHWDDFTAAVGTRAMSDTLAGAYLADPAEPLLPLGAAVDGVFAEVLRKWQPAAGNRAAGWQQSFRGVEWNPTVYTLATDGFSAVSCLSRLALPNWGDHLSLPGELAAPGDYSDWSSLQHWAVWRDHLVGFNVLRCHAAGGDPAGQDVARLRWRLAPAGRTLTPEQSADDRWAFRYGGLQVRLQRLEEQGGFRFAGMTGEPKPRADAYPVLARPAPWAPGDHVYAATIIAPVGAPGQVLVKPLFQGGAMLLVEPGGRRAYLWLVNLERFWRQFLWTLPAGVTAPSYKWEHTLMPPVPPGEPASVGLSGGESCVWVVESAQPLQAQALLDTVRAGKGRWGSPPA